MALWHAGQGPRPTGAAKFNLDRRCSEMNEPLLEAFVWTEKLQSEWTG